MYDSPWAGHPRRNRMVALMSRSCYRLTLRADVAMYVKTQDKVERRKTPRLIQPLPIPEQPWVFVSMDFITSFPRVDGKASILVVFDRFLKYGVFIVAVEPCTAEILFFHHMVKLFRLPANIVRDRNTRFTRKFWTMLFK